MRSWSSPWLSLISSPKSLLYFGVILVSLLFLPLLTVLSFPIFLLARFVSSFRPNYGKFIGYFDAWMEEEFVTKIPRSSVVTTLTIQGDLTVDEFRSIFKANVLEAPSALNPGKTRYPELKQYLTTFMGFRIWKDDDHFQIENHIREGFQEAEECRQWNNNGKNQCEHVLSNIHQKLLNLPYEKERSPWEIILIRNVKLHHNNASAPQTLVACRTHHVLADAKSLIKLFVECLGDQELKSATAQSVPQESWVDTIKFYIMYFGHVFTLNTYLTFTLAKSHFHPFKTFEYWKDRDVKTVLAFSPKLLMSDVKKVAKKNSVTGSAVVMSIVTGGIRKCGEELRKCEVAIGYTLPKPNHPEMMTNHLYMTFLKLPTNKEDIHERLKQCNKNFLRIKSNQQGRYVDFTTIMGGSQIFPLTRLAVNQFTPMGITNIAGEEIGFSMGKGEVIDFRMSVGTLGGVAGVVFCAFSYKDGIRIAVIAKETVLNKIEVEKLALDMEDELKLLASV